jgi:hypothetical protein
MRRCWAIVACAICLLIPACGRSPVAPVAISTPDNATLHSLLGQAVTVEGRVILTKEGMLLGTTSESIYLDYRGANDGSWPTQGSHVRATGILRLEQRKWGESFHLERPESQPVQSQ